MHKRPVPPTVPNRGVRGLMSSKASVAVPFFDWKSLYAERADKFADIMRDTASGGGFILQAAVDEFENALASYLGARHAVGISDCTNAMLLGLRLLDLRPGDEIILPSHAFIAAAQAIHFAGAVPVPVDLSGKDWLMDPGAVRAAVTPRTRAIMPVHVNGRACAMNRIVEIAAEHELAVVEDAAQALGARFDGRAAGTFGLWGAFSFYPSKTLGCFGDAGALVTNDDEIAAKVQAMRNHGAGADKVVGRDCAIWGTNARIDNIQAAILVYKLTYYEEAVARRRAIASAYHEAFAPIAALDLPPAPNADTRHFDVYQNYELCCDARDALRAHLSERGIGTIIQWGGIGIHGFRNLGFDQELPRTDRFFTRSLLIPMNHLLSDAQVSDVIRGVRSFFS